MFIFPKNQKNNVILPRVNQIKLKIKELKKEKSKLL